MAYIERLDAHNLVRRSGLKVNYLIIAKCKTFGGIETRSLQQIEFFPLHKIMKKIRLSQFNSILCTSIIYRNNFFYLNKKYIEDIP